MAGGVSEDVWPVSSKFQGPCSIGKRLPTDAALYPRRTDSSIFNMSFLLLSFLFLLCFQKSFSFVLLELFFLFSVLSFLNTLRIPVIVIRGLRRGGESVFIFLEAASCLRLEYACIYALLIWELFCIKAKEIRTEFLQKEIPPENGELKYGKGKIGSDLRFPLQCKCHFRSSRILRSKVDNYLSTFQYNLSVSSSRVKLSSKILN